MIERLIYTALQAGITELLENPLRFHRIFVDYYGLTDGETAKIREYFEANPPKVIHSYAREDSKFPLYAIILQSEMETDKALGDYGGMITFDEALAAGDSGASGAEVFGSIFTYNYEIITYAKLPDVTLYYYYLAKYFMIREREYFVENDLFDLNLGGLDLAPDPRYLPAHLFGRTLRFSCQREMAVIGESVVRASKVEGIHVTDTLPETNESGTRLNVTIKESL